MAKIVLSHVRKIYKDALEEANKNQGIPVTSGLEITPEGVVAVQDFCMEIADKEFIVLVGPSGCGKSTTLRMVAGLEEITGGDLYIDDVRVNDLPPKDRDISMVFQNYALYPHMTVFENMAFPLKLRKLPKDEIRRKVEQAAAILDITNQLSRKPKALSGGQRQRVAIGRAIVRNPKVLLMDEPLSNLDAKLRTQMRAEIIKLRKVINTTFLYVTHDQIEAMTLGDRIVIMKDGFVQQIGTPEEVFNHPENLFVASFIGTPQMNFFDATLKKTDAGYAAVIAGKTFLLPEDKQQKLSEMETVPNAVVAGIRPVFMHLADDGIEGVMEIAERTGSEVQLHVKTGETSVILVLPTIDVDKELLSRHGTPIRYSFRPDLLCLFDKETEENIF